MDGSRGSTDAEQKIGDTGAMGGPDQRRLKPCHPIVAVGAGMARWNGSPPSFRIRSGRTLVQSLVGAARSPSLVNIQKAKKMQGANQIQTRP